MHKAYQKIQSNYGLSTSTYSIAVYVSYHPNYSTIYPSNAILDLNVVLIVSVISSGIFYCANVLVITLSKPNCTGLYLYMFSLLIPAHASVSPERSSRGLPYFPGLEMLHK